MDKATLLMLLNAVAFKGKTWNSIFLTKNASDQWGKTFDKLLTRTGVFHVRGTSKENVEMMFLEDEMTYYSKGDDYRFIAKPFKVKLNTLHTRPFS